MLWVFSFAFLSHLIPAKYLICYFFSSLGQICYAHTECRWKKWLYLSQYNRRSILCCGKTWWQNSLVHQRGGHLKNTQKLRKVCIFLIIIIFFLILADWKFFRFMTAYWPIYKRRIIGKFSITWVYSNLST